MKGFLMFLAFAILCLSLVVYSYKSAAIIIENEESFWFLLIPIGITLVIGVVYGLISSNQTK